MIKCDYFKKSINNCKCKLTNSTITLLDCIKCAKFKQTSVSSINITPRSKSVLKRIKTPLNKVSKKRIFVSKNTYEEVFNRDKGQCALCSSNFSLQYHHILYRSERKDLIDKPSNGIILCLNCHNLVHSNKKKYQPLLLEIVEKNSK
jgi:5-methylcytosine-specific restriction endonuclease McrA